MESVIRLEAVRYTAKKKQILKGIDLQLNRNEVVALTGPNGAGKTTLSKVIMGVIKATEGDVYIDDRHVEEMKLFEVGRKIGYLFQNPTHQIFMTTVQEELSFTMRHNKVDEGIIESEVNDMMERFNLCGIKDHLTFHLSQGEKQRVALATILLNKPEYLILDEPFKGLDLEHKQQIMDYLHKIYQLGIGLMIITHDKKVLESFATRMIVMGGGVIEEDKQLRSEN